MTCLTSAEKCCRLFVTRCTLAPKPGLIPKCLNALLSPARYPPGWEIRVTPKGGTARTWDDPRLSSPSTLHDFIISGANLRCTRRNVYVASKSGEVTSLKIVSPRLCKKFQKSRNVDSCSRLIANQVIWTPLSTRLPNHPTLPGRLATYSRATYHILYWNIHPRSNQPGTSHIHRPAHWALYHQFLQDDPRRDQWKASKPSCIAGSHGSRVIPPHASTPVYSVDTGKPIEENKKEHLYLLVEYRLCKRVHLWLQRNHPIGGI